MDTFPPEHQHSQKHRLYKYVYTCSMLLLAWAQHFTIMQADLWPWGLMIVLNSITVREQSVLCIHFSSTVTRCWCSSKINASTDPTSHHHCCRLCSQVILALTSCYSDYVISRVAGKNGWNTVLWKESLKQKTGQEQWNSVTCTLMSCFIPVGDTR